MFCSIWGPGIALRKISAVFGLLFLASCASTGVINPDAPGKTKTQSKESSAVDAKLETLKKKLTATLFDENIEFLPTDSDGKVTFKKEFKGIALKNTQPVIVQSGHVITVFDVLKSSKQRAKERKRATLDCIARSPAGNFKFQLPPNQVRLPVYGKATPKVLVTCKNQSGGLIFGTLPPKSSWSFFGTRYHYGGPYVITSRKKR